jgi:uncharacterized protein (DUF1778 family)
MAAKPHFDMNAIPTYNVSTGKVKDSMAHMIPQEPRSRRINLRATPYQENLIRAGAMRHGENVSDFILESACTRAEEAISDQVHFIASEAQWKAFTKALDAPPRVLPKLKRLFSKPWLAESR